MGLLRRTAERMSLAAAIAIGIGMLPGIVSPACAVEGGDGAFAAESDGPSQWERVVASLSSPSYDEREGAFERLVGGREAAFDAVVDGLSRPGEVATRSLCVLERWAFDSNDDFAETCERTLMTLAESFDAEVASLSDQSLMTARDMRQKRAVEAIRNFNGEVRFADHQQHATPLRAVPAATPGLQAAANDPVDQQGRIDLVAIYKDWSGNVEDLWHLRRLRHIAGLSIRVSNKNIPDAAVSSVASVLESAVVSFVGASLGLRASSGQPLRIEEVFPGTAASNAGLQAGDVITEFNNEEIANISDLIQLLRKYDPGDKGTLRFERFGEERSVEVTLQGWREMPTPQNILRQIQQQNMQRRFLFPQAQPRPPRFIAPPPQQGREPEIEGPAGGE